jgi:hypothetical protein
LLAAPWQLRVICAIQFDPADAARTSDRSWNTPNATTVRAGRRGENGCPGSNDPHGFDLTTDTEATNSRTTDRLTERHTSTKNFGLGTVERRKKNYLWILVAKLMQFSKTSEPERKFRDFFSRFYDATLVNGVDRSG